MNLLRKLAEEGRAPNNPNPQHNRPGLQSSNNYLGASSSTASSEVITSDNGTEHSTSPNLRRKSQKRDFGFVVMGHEFDSYPKKMIRDIKSWYWFLEEEHKDGDDDNGRNVKHGHGRKRKKAAEIDDEEWTVDSEGETILILFVGYLLA